MMPSVCTVIVIASARVATPPVLSVALTVKLAVPAAAGVPLIVPDADRLRFAGKLPPEPV